MRKAYVLSKVVDVYNPPGSLGGTITTILEVYTDKGKAEARAESLQREHLQHYYRVEEKDLIE